VVQFRELVPEGMTPRQFFGELMSEAIKQNRDGIQS
jgi:hypothetical protein